MGTSSERRGALPRNRLIALLVVGIVAATLVVGPAALATHDPAVAVTTATDRTTSQPLPGRPAIVVTPIAGAPSDPVTRVAWAQQRRTAQPSIDADLRLAEAQAAAGDLAAAEATLRGLDDPRARVAISLLQYDAGNPGIAIAQLAQLAETTANDPFVQFSYGLALLWSGQRAAGEKVLRSLRDAAPESFYGTSAGDLLHPATAPGYPPFIASTVAATETLADAKAAAQAAPTLAQPQIAYGAALLAAGQRSAAADAFDAALVADPKSVEAKVGKIIAGYNKDNPAGSFGQMGPLVRDNPTDPSPRLHLALMLLWLRDTDTARAQLRQVATLAPNARLGKIAQQFLDAL